MKGTRSQTPNRVCAGAQEDFAPADRLPSAWFNFFFFCSVIDTALVDTIFPSRASNPYRLIRHSQDCFDQVAASKRGSAGIYARIDRNCVLDATIPSKSRSAIKTSPNCFGSPTRVTQRILDRY